MLDLLGERTNGFVWHGTPQQPLYPLETAETMVDLIYSTSSKINYVHRKTQVRGQGGVVCCLLAGAGIPWAAPFNATRDKGKRNRRDSFYIQNARKYSGIIGLTFMGAWKRHNWAKIKENIEAYLVIQIYKHVCISFLGEKKGRDAM